MIKDEIIKQLFKCYKTHFNLSKAAREVGISYPTAQKYKYLYMLPSQIKASQPRRGERLFLSDWEKLVLPFLKLNPNAPASAILEHLIAIRPEKYCKNNLRTIQRRLKEWRNQTELFVMERAIDDYDFGELCVTGLLAPPLPIYIRGVRFSHHLFMIYFTKPLWVYVDINQFDGLLGLTPPQLNLLEEAFWNFGFLPSYHWHHSYIKRAETEDQSRYKIFNALPGSLRLLKDPRYVSFTRHYQIKLIDNHYVYPPLWRKARYQFISGFKEAFRKCNTFNYLDDYRSELRSISKNLNSTVRKTDLTKLDKVARRVPSERGFRGLWGFTLPHANK